MGNTQGTPDIDLSAINNEIAGMSKEALEAEVLKLRVRQKTQQKRQQGSGAQKQYQLKQRAKFKAMKEAAIKLGIWDKINDQAEELAEQKLAEDESVGEEVEA
jgi:hypothetical protein